MPSSFAGSIPTAETKAALARATGAMTEAAFDALSDESKAGATSWLDEEWRIKTVAANGVDAFSLKVWLGDGATGTKDGDPRPRNTKGPETREDVRSNNSQRGLFDELPADERSRILELRTVQEDGRLFIVLLFRYHFEEDKCRIHWELSVPGVYDESAQTVTQWVHREVFPDFVINLGDDDDTYESGADPDPTLDRG